MSVIDEAVAGEATQLRQEVYMYWYKNCSYILRKLSGFMLRLIVNQRIEVSGRLGSASRCTVVQDVNTHDRT